MKKNLLVLLLSLTSSLWGETFYGRDVVLSAPKVGEAGSTAIHKESSSFVAWANGFENLQYGSNVDDTWKTPEKALGKALGTSTDIVSLGRGGQITLTFPQKIADGAGADFAVFENAFNDTFLELAYVEVSSDGIHFVRFPNYSYTTTSVGGFGGLDTRLIYNLASKYKQGYGHPFDLADLQRAYNAQLQGNTDFSSAFANQLTNNFPHLNLSSITHVRFIDVIGDGSAKDSRGEIIYDPYPTSGSAGFDLDAVGVINVYIPSTQSYSDWAVEHNLSTNRLDDADNDGVCNFFEYALGGDPNNPTNAPSPALSTQTNQMVCFEYAISRHAQVSETILKTGNLRNPNWLPATPQDVQINTTTDFIQHKAYFSITNKAFFQLQIQDRL